MKKNKKYLIKIIEDVDKNSSNWYYHSKLLIPTQKLEGAGIFDSIQDCEQIINERYKVFNGEMKDSICFIQIIEYSEGIYNVLKNYANQAKFPF